MSSMQNILSEPERSRILDSELVGWCARGWRVQTRSTTEAVITSGQPLSTGAHMVGLLITVLTCGVGLLLWGLMAVTAGKTHTRIIGVDEYGQRWMQK